MSSVLSSFFSETNDRIFFSVLGKNGYTLRSILFKVLKKTLPEFCATSYITDVSEYLHILSEKYSKFPRYNMKCSGKHDTA